MPLIGEHDSPRREAPSSPVLPNHLVTVISSRNVKVTEVLSKEDPVNLKGLKVFLKASKFEAGIGVASFAPGIQAGY